MFNLPEPYSILGLLCLAVLIITCIFIENCITFNNYEGQTAKSSIKQILSVISLQTLFHFISKTFLVILKLNDIK